MAGLRSYDGWTYEEVGICHLLNDELPMSQFTVCITDEIAINCYTAEEFAEIRDCMFGMAYNGDGEWECLRDEPCMWTIYRGKGTINLVQLFMAFAQGQAIRYMDVMGWR